MVVASETETDVPAIVGASSGGWGPWPYQWLCSGTSFGCATDLLEDPDSWSITYQYWTYPVSYCLSKKMKDSCTLQYGYIITWIVIYGNAIKLLCFLATYRLLEKADRNPTSNDQAIGLVFSSGDAIASFLSREDPHTHNMCLAEKDDFENGIWRRWAEVKPIRWHKRHKRAWFRAVGLWRWLAFIAL